MSSLSCALRSDKGSETLTKMITNVIRRKYVNSEPKNDFKYENKPLKKKKANINDSVKPQMIVG